MKNLMTTTEKPSTSTDFITKLDFKFDVAALREDMDDFTFMLDDYSRNECTVYNQMGLKHRKGAENVHIDSMGSLYDREKKEVISKESDFSEYNPNIGMYTKSVIEKIEEEQKIRIGRARYMTLPPKTGLSVHFDMEERLHLVLKTNKTAFIANYTGDEGCEAICTHLPADGYVYKVDTTRNHFVYNGGWEDRIHLVLCIT
jgi:hypothetical protein